MKKKSTFLATTLLFVIGMFINTSSALAEEYSNARCYYNVHAYDTCYLMLTYTQDGYIKGNVVGGYESKNYQPEDHRAYCSKYGIELSSGVKNNHKAWIKDGKIISDGNDCPAMYCKLDKKSKKYSCYKTSKHDDVEEYTYASRAPFYYNQGMKYKVNGVDQTKIKKIRDCTYVISTLTGNVDGERTRDYRIQLTLSYYDNKKVAVTTNSGLACAATKATFDDDFDASKFANGCPDTIYYNGGKTSKTNPNCMTDNLKISTKDNYKFQLMEKSIEKKANKDTAAYTDDKLTEKAKKNSNKKYNDSLAHKDPKSLKLNDKEGCDLLGVTLIKFLNTKIFSLLKIALVGLLIVFGMMDFSKALFSDNPDDALKKATSKFVKRIIVVVLVFLLPIIIETIIGWFLNSVNGINVDSCMKGFK